RLVPPLVWASLVLGFGFCAFNALTVHYATLLQTVAGLGLSDVSRLVKIFNVGMLLGAPLLGFIAQRAGARIALASAAVALLPALPWYLGMRPSGLAMGALAAGLFGAGSSGVTPLLLTQLFPEPIRARCMGFVYHAGAAAGAAVPTLV